MASNYHEPAQEMSNKARDIIRALNTFKEEIEAIDWYGQRIDVCTDQELKEIMTHNMHEEMEHAMMSLEWLRRNQDGWDKQMRTYLFTTGNILELEKNGGEDANSKPNSSRDDLGIGQL